MSKGYILPNMGGTTISNRLTQKLLQEMVSGSFMQIDRLPSEIELAEKYGVSRSVIRDVLANLEREGFVERGRGIGTVVNRQIVNMKSRLDLKLEYNNLVRSVGAVPSTGEVKLYEKAANEMLAKKLQIKVNDPLIICEKWVYASGVPAIYSIDHLPKELFEAREWQNFDWAAPVFDLLENHLGIVVDTNITDVSAIKGDDILRQKMNVKEDAAILLLDEVGYYKLSKPILHSYQYFSDYFKFTMLRKLF